MKRRMTIALSVIIMIWILFPVDRTIPQYTRVHASSDSYETAWFPAPVMNLTQIAYESLSHGENNTVDIDPGGDVFAPYTGKIVLTAPEWGFVLFQSLDKVFYANGTLDYMTVGFMHDSDISDLSVGQVISQGTPFYQAGGMGDGDPEAYGKHVDLSVYKGKLNSVSWYGQGNVYAFNAFYINRNMTRSIINKGKAYTDISSLGEYADWNNLWKVLGEGVDPHVHDRAELKYTDSEHPHYNYYICSICGELWCDEETLNYVDYCNMCNIKVTVNGKQLNFDQPPVALNGRTLVPLRAIFEAMGATVEWDEDTQTVTSRKDYTTVRLTLGDSNMYLNGYSIPLDVPAQAFNGRTLVPVRAITEAFGADVNWDQNDNTVVIKFRERFSY